MKSGNTSYRRQMIVERRHQRFSVGETYKARQEYERKKIEAEASSPSFLGKIRDFFLGPKLPNIHDFAPNASYVSGVKTITQYHKEMEHGIKSDAPPATDDELLAILARVENDPNVR